jgi:hypothetical protein
VQAVVEAVDMVAAVVQAELAEVVVVEMEQPLVVLEAQETQIQALAVVVAVFLMVEILEVVVMADQAL